MHMIYILVAFLLGSAIANTLIYFFLSRNYTILAFGYKLFSAFSFLYATFFMGVSDIHSLKWGFYLLLLLTLPQLIFLVYWLIFVLPLFKLPQMQNISMLVGIAILFIFTGLMLHGAFIGRTKIVTPLVEVHSSRLPAEFDGFRIVRFSDLHAGSFIDKPEFVGQVIEKINGLKPDMVVFTGDIVNNKSNELDQYASVLASIQAPYGVYSILGNHDYGDYVRWENTASKKENLAKLIDIQEQMGWRMLNDENTTIKKGDAAIALVGVENWGEPPFATYGDFHVADAGVDPKLFTILLSHNPSHWQRQVLPDTNIDLMLAGHTHAMQIKILGFSPSRIRYKEWSGLYNQGERYLYVNEGIGSIFVPMRIGAYPEITVIELKKV